MDINEKKMLSENSRKTHGVLLPLAIFAVIATMIAQAIYITCISQQLKQHDSKIERLENKIERLANSKIYEKEPQESSEERDHQFLKPKPHFVIQKNDFGPSRQRDEIKLQKFDIDDMESSDKRNINERQNFDNKHDQILSKIGGYSLRDSERHDVRKRDLSEEAKKKKTAKWLRRLKRMKGEKGDKGDKGDRGPKGPAGKMGPKGEKGEPGETITATKSHATEMIHLVGDGGMYDMSKVETAGSIFKRWRTAEIVGKLSHSHEDGRIHIEVSGYYYVYCQLHYHGQLVLNQHQVWKDKRGLMMYGFDTYNNTLTGVKRHSSTNYIGGIFKMLKGDSIYVSGMKTMYFFSPKSSYFGMFLLHELP